MSSSKRGSSRKTKKRDGSRSHRGSSRGSRRGQSKTRRIVSGKVGETSSTSAKSSSPRLPASEDATKLAKTFKDAGLQYGVNGSLRVQGDRGKERDVVHTAIMGVWAKSLIPAPPGAPRPDNVHLGIVTTAPIETFGVISVLSDCLYYPVFLGVNRWHCYVGTFGATRAVVVKTDQGPSGSHGSINATSMLCSLWGVKLIWAVGIALGADPKKQQYGDVLVGSAVQVYETKVQGQSGGKTTTTLRHKPFLQSKALAAVSEAAAAKWKGPDGLKARVGLVVSAPKLLDDAATTAEQLNVVRKALPKLTVVGGEMEMGGVISVCLGNGVPWGICKGICDFGGLDKAKSKEAQPLATVNAVAWLMEAVGDGAWIRSLPGALIRSMTVLSFDEYLAVKRHKFLGRKELFGKVESWLSAPESRVLLVKGQPGTGKSAFLAELAARRERDLIALHFCQFADASTLDARVWLLSMAGQIVRWARAHNLAIAVSALDALVDNSRSVPDVFEGLLKALPANAGGQDQTWILLVDSLDEALSGGGNGKDIVRALGRGKRSAPAWLRIVLSSRSDLNVLQALEDELGGPVDSLEATGEENERDARAWLVKHGGVLKEETLDAVIKASRGNFLYVRQVVIDGDLDSRVASAEGLPDGLVGVYSQRARALWLAPDEWEVDLPLLSGLCVARGPIGGTLLKDAVSKIAGGPVNTRRAVGALSSVLDVSDEGGVRLFHKTFSDWCADVGMDGRTTNEKSGHQGLAEAGLELWKSGDAYAIRHSLAHAVLGGDKKLVKDLLAGMALQWDWMLRRAELDGWGEVASDLEMIGGDGRRAGAVVRQWMDGGWHSVADGLALYGPEPLRSEMAKVVNAVPINTKRFNDALDMRLKGHSADVTGAVELGDSSRVATTSEDGTLRVWDVGSGQLRQTLAHPVVARGLKPRGGVERGLAVLPDGVTLVAGAQRQVSFWNVRSGTAESHVEGPPGWTAQVLAVDESRVVVCGQSVLSVYDRGTDGGWGVTRELKKETVMIGAMALYPKDKNGDVRVACGGEKGSIWIWNLTQGLEEGTLRDHDSVITALAVLGDGRLVSSSLDGTVRVWPASRKGASKIIKTGHSEAVTALAVLNGGSKFVSGSRDSTLRVFDAARRGVPCIALLRGHSTGVSCLTALSDGRVLSGSRNGEVMIWNPEEAGPVEEPVEGVSEVTLCCCAMKDGRVVSGTNGGRVIVWAAPVSGEKPRAEAVLMNHSEGLNAIASNWSWGFVTGSWDGVVRVMTEKKKGKWEATSTLNGHSGRIRSLAIMPDGNRIVSGTNESKQLGVWSAIEGVQLLLEVMDDSVMQIEPVSADRVAIGGGYGKIRVVDVVNGAVLRAFEGHSGTATGLVSMMDQPLLVSGSVDGSVRVWDIDIGGKASTVMEGPVLVPDAIFAEGRSGVSRVLVHASGGNSVEVWDLKTKSRERTILHLEEPIAAVLWNPRGSGVLLVLGVRRGWMAYIFNQ